MPFSKKQYIAQTFLSLCHTKPMGKVTIQEIADHCGISRRTFYNHFPDKQAIVEYLYLSHFGDMMEELQDIHRWGRKASAVFAQDLSFYTQAIRETNFLSWLEHWLYQSMARYIAYTYGAEQLTPEVQHTLKSYLIGVFHALPLSSPELLRRLDLQEIGRIDRQNMPLLLQRFFPPASDSAPGDA